MTKIKFNFSMSSCNASKFVVGIGLGVTGVESQSSTSLFFFFWVTTFVTLPGIGQYHAGKVYRFIHRRQKKKSAVGSRDNMTWGGCLVLLNKGKEGGLSCCSFFVVVSLLLLWTPLNAPIWVDVLIFILPEESSTDSSKKPPTSNSLFFVIFDMDWRDSRALPNIINFWFFLTLLRPVALRSQRMMRRFCVPTWIHQHECTIQNSAWILLTLCWSAIRPQKVVLIYFEMLRSTPCSDVFTQWHWLEQPTNIQHLQHSYIFNRSKHWFRRVLVHGAQVYETMSVWLQVISWRPVTLQ